MVTDLRVAKRQEQQAAYYAGRDAFEAAGPFVEDGMLVIPSPQRNNAFKARLTLAGFQYKGCPNYGHPHYAIIVPNGNSAAWLARARVVYEEYFGIECKNE